MRRFSLEQAIRVLVACILVQFCLVPVTHCGQAEFPEAVKIVAPDQQTTSVLSQPKHRAETIGLVFHGDILEKLGEENDFVKVRLPDTDRPGFVPKQHTELWVAPPARKTSPLLWALIIVLTGGLGGALAFFFFRSKKSTRDAAKHTASISSSIKRAEADFTGGNYEQAAAEFKNYLRLQGGEVRDPDVYRRLTVCFQKMNDIEQAAGSWEKMRSLGGLQSIDDYTLGVELMMAVGEEASAASVYEQLLTHETDKNRRLDIHNRLVEIYRSLKDPRKFLKHVRELMELGDQGPELVSGAGRFLITEEETDLAVELDNKPLITVIAEEFLEERIVTPEAKRIFVKCLQYDRTDLRFHRILADIYNAEGDFRNAVSELTVLDQLDKDTKTEYVEEAARIYVENSLIADALAGGNPAIIKKIAQIYLANSEVNPDAVAVYEKVLEFQPTAVGINKMLRTVYLTRGDLEKYMKKLRLLHQVDGVNHDYLGELAQCVIDNNLFEQTIQEGNRELNAKILKKMMKRGAHDDRSVALFERLVRYEPRSVPVRKALAHAYAGRGELEKSLDNLLAVCDIQPDDEKTAQRAAKVAVENELLEPVVKEAQGMVLTVTAKELARNKVTGDLCRQVLEKALAENPGDRDIGSYLESLPGGSEITTGARRAESPSASRSKSPPKADFGAEAGPQTTSSPKKKDRIEQDLKPAEKKPEIRDKTSDEMVLFESAIDEVVPQKEAAGEKKVDHEPPVEPLVQEQVVDTAYQVASENESHPVTTFVSSHEKGGGRPAPDTADLFWPDAGGLAYGTDEVLFTDGWGDWHAGSEANTGKKVLMRVLDDKILKASIREDFVKGISELGFSMLHDNILCLDEMAKDGAGRIGLIYPCLPQTLEQVLESKENIDLEIMIDLARKIVGGLSFAHNHMGRDGKIRRTFHLHLQPSQVFVSKDLKTCCIAGLGYSQLFRNLTAARQPRWKDPGMNPAYMPPEFFRSKTAGTLERSADIYSLGVVLYYMVSGEHPFEGSSRDDYKYQHDKVFPAPPRLIRPTVPTSLEKVVLGCLEKRPDKRWSSVNEIERALNREIVQGLE